MSIPRSSGNSEDTTGECERVVVHINYTGQCESDIEEGEIVEENIVSVENESNEDREAENCVEANSIESVASTDDKNENCSVNSQPLEGDEEFVEQKLENINELFIHEPELDESCLSSRRYKLKQRSSTLSMVLRSSTNRKIAKYCEELSKEKEESSTSSRVKKSPFPYLPPPPPLVEHYPELFAEIVIENYISDSDEDDEDKEEKEEVKRLRNLERIEDVKQKRRHAINRIRGIGPYWHPYIEEDSDVDDYDEDKLDHSLLWGDGEDEMKRDAETNNVGYYPERNYEYIYGELYDNISKVAREQLGGNLDESTADPQQSTSRGTKRKMTLGEYYCSVSATKRRILELSSPSRTVAPVPDVPDYALAAGVPSSRSPLIGCLSVDHVTDPVVAVESVQNPVAVDLIQENRESTEPDEKPEDEVPEDTSEETSEDSSDKLPVVTTRKRKRDFDEDSSEEDGSSSSKKPRNYMI